MCECMYVYMYVGIMCVRIYVCMYAWMYVCILLYMYVCIYVSMYIYVLTYGSIFDCMKAWKCIY